MPYPYPKYQADHTHPTLCGLIAMARRFAKAAGAGNQHDLIGGFWAARSGNAAGAVPITWVMFVKLR